MDEDMSSKTCLRKGWTGLHAVPLDVTDPWTDEDPICEGRILKDLEGIEVPMGEGGK